MQGSSHVLIDSLKLSPSVNQSLKIFGIGVDACTVKRRNIFVSVRLLGHRHLQYFFSQGFITENISMELVETPIWMLNQVLNDLMSNLMVTGSNRLENITLK